MCAVESKALRVLAFTRYGPAGASSRYRFFQFRAGLREYGIQVDFAPLLPDQYVHALYQKERFGLARVARAYAERILRLGTLRRADVLWVEGELFPWLPDVAEAVFEGRPFVVDYDDAIFLRYDGHRSRLVQAALRGKIDNIMRRAHTVVVGSAYLEKHARQAGARSVKWLPTVVDVGRYAVRQHSMGGSLRIGWIGSPSTQDYLRLVASPLREAVRAGAHVVAIGASPDFAIEGLPLRILPWSEETEAEELGKLSIGIMPLTDDLWSRGKCGFKLVQYMAAGVPVIASAVGENTRIVAAGESGYTAISEEDWRRAFSSLAADIGLRERMGAAGRVRAEQVYSRGAVLPELATILRRAGEGMT